MIINRRSLLLATLTLPPTALRGVETEAPDSVDHIGMLVFPGFTALDFVGPHHFLAPMPNTRVHVVTTGADLAPVSSDTGLLVHPTTTMEACPERLSVLFVPGGTSGTVAAAADLSVLEFVADRAARATYVTSVCTGSLVLGAAGVLSGRRATSHWATLPLLSRFEALPVNERVVRDGNVITGAGVSAGLDFGITVAEEMRGRTFAEAGVLVSEYAPEPPIVGGTHETANPAVAAMLQENLSDFVAAAGALEMLT